MLQHAVDVYTPEVFTLFQKEYTAIGDYVAKRVNKSEMEKKKELVKANKWILPASDLELVEEEDEVLNARGIKRKNPPGRPKNKKVGRHGRYLSVLETKNRGISKSSNNGTAKKKLSFQDTSLPPDTQLSVVSATSPISYNEPSFSQLLEEFDKNRDGSS
ncbi:hypothetical protein Rs2_41052 [Raphanus sativus]|nr:hypothetical protein Rs2_41052 [Raphanus sativus]